MDSDSEDKLSVKVSKSGVEVTAAGEASKSLSKSLVEILSPFTNSLGFIGDRLAMARRASVIRAAKKATERLADEGITKGCIPPKLLLPWLEGVSLEVDDDETLQDMWAGLLVRSVKSSDAANISYCDVLKKIGTDEAKLLHWWATDTPAFNSSKYYELNDTDPMSNSNPLLPNICSYLDSSSSNDELRENIDKLSIQTMRQPIFFSINGTRFETTPFFEANESAVSNLEHLGVIRIRTSKFESDFNKYSIVWFALTKFGFDLMYACQGTVVGGERQFLNSMRENSDK